MFFTLKVYSRQIDLLKEHLQDSDDKAARYLDRFRKNLEIYMEKNNEIFLEEFKRFNHLRFKIEGLKLAIFVRKIKRDDRSLVLSEH